MSSGSVAEQKMQLAQLDGGGAGGGAGTLATSAADKARAQAYIRDHLTRNTADAGRMAEGGGAGPVPVTPVAPTPSVLRADTGLEGLSEWASAAGLSDAMSTWRGQVGRLMARLGREQAALGEAKDIFRGHELSTSSELDSVRVAPPSPFDRM
ncbi:hypothetical protein ACFV6M_06460 [Streptomyces californicus]|uniref:hypothetical protein n=1 Tax=Streptomyces TaxID=1883 RepID=UPI0012FF3C55|nr:MULTISPECIES: hypothetical protein [Streptomyces]QRV56392.1 hypothetical protein I6J40_20965 [Streptomyces californicus]